MSRPLFARLTRDTRGISAVEFALLAPPFFIMLMGSFDFAYQAYVRATTQGAADTLARAVSVQSVTETTAVDAMKNTVRKVAPAATFQVVRGSVSRFSQFGAMERLTLDLNNNGVLDGPVDTDGDGNPDKSDCWEDVDNNNVRNTVTIGRDSIGGADDLVRYNITVGYKRLFPIWSMIGIPRDATVAAATIVRRQPYEAQAPAPVRCAT